MTKIPETYEELVDHAWDGILDLMFSLRNNISTEIDQRYETREEMLLHVMMKKITTDLTDLSVFVKSFNGLGKDEKKS
jgi:hypothetical protein